VLKTSAENGYFFGHGSPLLELFKLLSWLLFLLLFRMTGILAMSCS